MLRAEVGSHDDVESVNLGTGLEKRNWRQKRGYLNGYRVFGVWCLEFPLMQTTFKEIRTQSLNILNPESFSFFITITIIAFCLVSYFVLNLLVFFVLFILLCIVNVKNIMRF